MSVTVGAERGAETRLAPAYEHPGVVARVAAEQEIPTETAQRWFEETLRFLDGAAQARDLGDQAFGAVPSAPVDAAWHAFILHTRDYAAYCEQRFGAFVHHTPRDLTAADTDSDALDHLLGYLKTRVMLLERFGELDDELWPPP